MSNADNDKILSRIRGLFAKARAVAGTPEADVFNEKAFELIAKYGVDEQAATMTGVDGSIDDDKVIKVTYSFSNASYAMARIMLVWHIVRNLHCEAIHSFADGKEQIIVIGVARHIRRAKLLQGYLEPQMLAGAARVNPDTEGGAFDTRAKKALRAEWMEGYAYAIGTKIYDVEMAAMRQADRNAGDTSMAVQRETDEARARKAFEKLFPMRTRSKASNRRGSGFYAGAAAGSSADVGQTRVRAGNGTHALA